MDKSYWGCENMTSKRARENIQSEVWQAWHAFCKYEDGMRGVRLFKGEQRRYAKAFLDGLQFGEDYGRPANERSRA